VASLAHELMLRAKLSFGPEGGLLPPAAKTRRLTAREKACRDDEIVKARMCGRSWRGIAADHSLSERQCQAVMKEYRESNPTLRHRDPLELLDEMLERFEGAQDQLAEIAATSPHDATRVGAIRTALDAMRAQAQLLAAVGVLPRELREVRREVDARRVVTVILDVFQRHGVPVEAQREVVATLGARNGSVGYSS
jgi:hypothetical protein